MLGSLCARWKLGELVRRWVEYRDSARQMREADVATNAQEEQFLNVQARLTTLLQEFTDCVPFSVTEELRQEIAAITEFLKRYRDLRPDAASGPRRTQEFEAGWHEHYLFLNRLKGMKLQRRQQARAPRPGRVPTGLRGRHPIRYRRPLPGAGLLRFGIKAGIFVLVIYLVGQAFGIRWNESSHFIVNAPGTFAGVLENVLNALVSIWAGAVSLLRPTIVTYGVTPTIVLMVALALASFYWAFVRG